MGILFGSAQAAMVKAADKEKQQQDALPEYHTALLATCRVCGGVVGITANEPERAKAAAKTAAEWIRDGFCVRDMAVDEAKALLKGNWCKCGQADTTTAPLPLLGG